MNKIAEPSQPATPLVRPRNQRRYERTPLDTPFLRASLKGQRRAAVRVQNFSETGLAIEPSTNTRLKVGDRLSLRLPHLPGHAAGTFKVTGTVHKQHDQNIWGFKFDDLLREQWTEQKLLRHRYVTVAFAAIIAAVIVLLKARNIVSFWYGPMLQTYSLAAALYILTRVVIAGFYRKPADAGFTPPVSLIVAVKNEEAFIAKTVAHCFKSRYPSEKFEVIVVDDGSTDNTWQALSQLENQYKNFRCFKFDANRGKRHAMAKGIREAKGDFLIFIDSDTFLEEEAIYRLVQPFANPKVGAVAGHTHMIVEEDNIISKMEAVRYYVSQRVIKAAESVFNTVTCCPGPLSGYRKSAVMPVLDKWEFQRFMGTQATFGDDRSLTNFVLRNYRVLYHAGAGCWTYAPSTLAVFIRQQLRWKKSWLREFTIAARFMWRKHPVAAFSYYASVVITLVSPLVVIGAVFGLSLFGTSFNFIGYLTGLLLVYAFLGLVYRYYTNSKYWAYGLVFAVMYLCIFSLQNYYALLTVRVNKWGTR